MDAAKVFRLCMLACAAAWPLAGAAQPAGCCTHLGGAVACPPGLPPGSASVEFVAGGTKWVTPSGQQVLVPATSFEACAGPTPPPSPSPSPSPPPPPPPPPGASPPPAAAPPPSGERPPRERPHAPPAVRMPASPPLILVPPPADDGRDADRAIGRMGTLLRAEEAKKQAVSAVAGPCPPAPGKAKHPGSRTRRAEPACGCEAPGVLKNEAPDGKAGGAAAAAALRVEVHVNPNWTVMRRAARGNLGDDSGRIHGVTRFGGIAGADGGCAVVKGNCPGECVTLAYEWVHLDFTAEIAYVRGMRNKAAHEAVHARQMGSAIQAALGGLAPNPAFVCMNRAAAERLLDSCKKQLVREARTLTTRTMVRWQADRDASHGSNRDYRSDPMEIEAFAEEEKGERAGFPPEVQPPPEFRTP